jgi:hypothetical protein
MECQYCIKECKNVNSLRNHERLCKNNPNRQILISNFIGYNKKKKELNIKGSNQYIKAEKLGLPKPKISEITKQKLRLANSKRVYTTEQKLRKSEEMKRAVERNPNSYLKNNVVGRVNNIEYNGVILKGSWELLVAKWLDSKSIKWEHETKSFKYEWNGTRTYYPDFYLPDYNLFIEVKGYQRDRDLAKWKVVPNLIVFNAKEINQIKKGIDISFVHQK